MFLQAIGNALSWHN